VASRRECADKAGDHNVATLPFFGWFIASIHPGVVVLYAFIPWFIPSVFLVE
jgi:hypothetical protein